MCPPILHNLGLYKYLILHKLDSMSSLKHQRFGNPTAQSPKSLPSDKFHGGSKGSSTPNISSPELSPRLKNPPVKPGKTGPDQCRVWGGGRSRLPSLACQLLNSRPFWGFFSNRFCTPLKWFAIITWNNPEKIGETPTSPRDLLPFNL